MMQQPRKTLAALPVLSKLTLLAIAAGAAAVCAPAAWAHKHLPIPIAGAPGTAEARCAPNETGPAILVDVQGLKDRKGLIKLEIYPSNDEDFLADDTVLLNAGKVFRRVEVPVPIDGPVVLCARIPGPGLYSLVLLHDRDSNHKFGFTVDGVGFASNPKLHWSRPKAEATRLVAGSGITRTAIVLNYWHGLGMSPIRDPQ